MSHHPFRLVVVLLHDEKEGPVRHAQASKVLRLVLWAPPALLGACGDHSTGGDGYADVDGDADSDAEPDSDTGAATRGRGRGRAG
jgi:hypothetical protein